MPYQFLRLLVLMSYCCFSFRCFAQEPLLEVKIGDQTRFWTRSALLALPSAQNITIKNDVAYHREMHYKAVPLHFVLPQLAQMESVQFIALDGFVANIAGATLASNGQAYLAIEPQDQAWPPIEQNNPNKTFSAGPFYLVWLTPEKAHIGSEQWPYQIGRISMAAPLTARFPQIIPKSKKHGDNEQAMRGLKVFLNNCMVCHQMNGGGDAAIGPDLNLPFNPTDYFQEKFFRQLVRQPNSVRSWKQLQMPGFDEQTISERQLDDLVVYLKRMASQR